MSDYINREAAIAALAPAYGGVEDYVRKVIGEIPAADVAPVKRGKWEPLSETQEDDPKAFAMYRCSACGKNSLQHRMGDRYCSQCGAKMEQSPGFIFHPFRSYAP